MRARLLRGIAMTALAVVVLLPGAATPVQATTGQAIKKVGEVAFRLFLDARQGDLTEQQLIQALQEFVAVVGEAEDAILTHLDAVASAPWVGAAEHAILEVPSLPLLTEDALLDYALEVALHARQAKSVFDAVDSDSEADHLGFAVYSLYSVGLEARVAAGLGTSTYMPNFRTAMQAIVDRLKPRCTSREGDMDYHPSIYHVVHTCTTPHGPRTFQDYQVSGEWREGPWTGATLEAAAGAGTSWEVARDALQRIDNGGR
ncbi:hypothetical protein [Plantactinospora soyae]|uniref:Uncharacterized protein n=1 Tax=Plantactinospora soyae TaxID=1544732 RepID=A0A927MCB9_9ACTN|nr:hypothetical protein [Plantactinospora soyae]MBE1491859.1 hypothetical protein [Plantactinospora soyae]